MKCPKCQTENPDKRKFCRECGAKLLSICPQCGAENPPDDKFCGDCGHSLVEPSVASPGRASVGQVASSVPTSFANGRYQVKKLLGEGGPRLRDQGVPRDEDAAITGTCPEAEEDTEGLELARLSCLRQSVPFPLNKTIPTAEQTSPCLSSGNKF